MRVGNHWLWIVTTVGAALRVALFVIAQPWTEHGEARLLAGSGDILSYHYLAHDLVLYGRYGSNPIADAYNLDPALRPMGYALFVAFWYWLFEPRLWYALLAQIVFSVISIILLYFLTRREFGERAAQVATLLFAIYPNGILFASTLMTETIYIFTTLLFLEVWSRFRARATYTPFTAIRYGLLLGFLLGLSVYVRVATVYLALLIPFAFWFFHTVLPKARRAQLITAFLSALIVTILPYSLYMHQRYGTFRLTIVDDYNLLINTVGHALGGYRRRADPKPVSFKHRLGVEVEARMRADGIDPINSNPFLRAPYYRQLALEYFRCYPVEIAWGMIKGMVRFWFLPDRVGEVANEVVPEKLPVRRALVGFAFAGAFAYHLVWLFLLSMGVFCAWRFHREWFWVFAITALYLTLTTNAAGNDRFRMQGAAFMFPLVGLGYMQVADRERKEPPRVVQYP